MQPHLQARYDNNSLTTAQPHRSHFSTCATTTAVTASALGTQHYDAALATTTTHCNGATSQHDTGSTGLATTSSTAQSGHLNIVQITHHCELNFILFLNKPSYTVAFCFIFSYFVWHKGVYEVASRCKNKAQDVLDLPQFFRQFKL